MCSVRLILCLRSSKPGLRLCIADVNSGTIYRRFVRLTTREKNECCGKIGNNLCSNSNDCSSNTNSLAKRLFHVETSANYRTQFFRGYCSTITAKKEDHFGELSGRRFEEFEMDDDEIAEEEFVENEARVSRRDKHIPKYVTLIKSHIGKGDLDAALRVLDSVTENREKPTTYMYNLVLRAFAVVGDFKRSRKLYVRMKKHGIDCNAATYTSILNACANYHHSESALDYLSDLRQEFAEKNVVLNETHYNAMIKTYGRHGKILEAFAIADIMRDNRLPTNIITFNSLLISTISDRQAGLRHALVVWYRMKRHCIKPTVTTYNLLLRAIRDTRLGNLKVNDVLLSKPPVCQVLLNDDSRPDLLQYPPTVNSLLFMELAAEKPGVEAGKEAKKGSGAKATLPTKVDPVSNEKGLAEIETLILNTPLDTIHEKNRLILFGGLDGILRNMEKDGVVPDAKSITLLMEIMPSSTRCEQNLINTARAKKIQLDVDFFNMLMKKRSFRGDYDGAKEVLDDMQHSGLMPDIITWGVLALSCHTVEDTKGLIDAMSATGHRLNPVIAGTLINNACKKRRFPLIIEMMNTMEDHNIQPNWKLYASLDKFQEEMNKIVASKKFPHTVNRPSFKYGFANFKTKYAAWRKKMELKQEKTKDRKQKSREVTS